MKRMSTLSDHYSGQYDISLASVTYAEGSHRQEICKLDRFRRIGRDKYRRLHLQAYPTATPPQRATS